MSATRIVRGGTGMNAETLPARRGGRFGDRTFAVLFGAAYLALLIHMPGRASLAEAMPSSSRAASTS